MRKRLQLSPEEKQRLTEAIAHFPRCRILVAGDLMLDTFVWGDVERISPEAPVPVVQVREETRLLGGTANVVHNVAALGAKVTAAGTIGNDAPGVELARLLSELQVPTDGLIVEEDRPTTQKMRIIARNQQVVRLDRERQSPLRRESLERVLAYIREHLPHTDGMIVSDYAKGVITPEFMDAVRSLSSDFGVPVIVDPKVRQPDLYRSVTMITPNHHEASRLSGVDITDEASLVRAGKLLIEQLECSMVLITRGKDGMSLFHRDGLVTHIPTVARRVFDVTGAGDTVLATITLGIVSGLSMVEAALLANLAAGIVVGEVGTAVVTADQLRDAVERDL